jgi:hypothetical protein
MKPTVERYILISGCFYDYMFSLLIKLNEYIRLIKMIKGVSAGSKHQIMPDGAKKVLRCWGVEKALRCSCM